MPADQRVNDDVTHGDELVQRASLLSCRANAVEHLLSQSVFWAFGAPQIETRGDSRSCDFKIWWRACRDYSKVRGAVSTLFLFLSGDYSPVAVVV